MFKKNDRHKQSGLFDANTYMNSAKQDRLYCSKGGYFYRLIFCNIREEDFSVLYSNKHSAPNSPINCMVAALLLMQKQGWTYAQLFEQIDFNLETRYALGLRDLDSIPFTEPTLFNFKRRLHAHHLATGEDLFGKLFDRLTGEQLKELALNTSIQRTDSLLLHSNIRSYSRVALIVEVLLRFYAILTEEEQHRYGGQLSDYIGKKANAYVRQIKPGEQTAHLQQLADAYHLLYNALADTYRSHQAFEVFARIYSEHFVLLETTEKTTILQPKPNEALHSGCLQSPDDITATYREKKGESHKGYVSMVTETCHPENALQLITDVHTAVNTTDDAQLLQGRIGKLKEQTPNLAELHHDGGFGSKQNDHSLQQAGITPIQTAIKGSAAQAPFQISRLPLSNTYTVQCANAQHPPVTATQPSKNYKAEFNLSICATCPFKDACPTKNSRKHSKGIASYKFKDEDYLRQQRHQNITQLPEERKKLRPNVEATMAQMRAGENRKGKLKQRGLLNASLYSTTMAIIINFGRIMRYKLAINLQNILFDVLGCLYRLRFSVLPAHTG